MALRVTSSESSCRCISPSRLLPHDSAFGAVLYGPVVLAGGLGSEDIPRGEFWSTDPTAHRLLPMSKVARLRQPEGRHSVPDSSCSRRDTELSARTALDNLHDVQLRPFYDTHFQRYAVYWRLMSPADWQREQARRAETRTPANRS